MMGHLSGYLNAAQVEISIAQQNGFYRNSNFDLLKKLFEGRKRNFPFCGFRLDET
jgi:hypothetical protein